MERAPSQFLSRGSWAGIRGPMRTMEANGACATINVTVTFGAISAFRVIDVVKFSSLTVRFRARKIYTRAKTKAGGFSPACGAGPRP